MAKSILTLGFLRGILFHGNLYAANRSFLDLEVLLIETLMLRNKFAIQAFFPPHSHQFTIDNVVIKGIDLFVFKGRACLNRNNEFQVLLKKTVHIALTIKSTVREQLNFFEAKNYEFGDKILHSSNIRNIAN